jgi:hypothetical protein
MLSDIIDDFRELLRQKQVREVKVAERSLEEQARQTPDIMLQQTLYEFAADQIQREQLAEVESDFAFSVLEAPSASDIKVWPPTLLLCFLAAIVTFALVAGYILFVYPSLFNAADPLVLHEVVVHTGAHEAQRASISIGGPQHPAS